MPVHDVRGRITAVLGPTNTGKTHLAVERMLGHATGMIGCPLRLLAREIYDRVAAQRGSGAVALVTGEEKIIPDRPRYFVCTVESMPLDVPVEFLAVDEIQLAADPERGHVFTDRLLNARGQSETMFLGAETVRPMIRRLVPRAEFLTRPRFSSLSYVGPKKVTKLPRRSAVIAFSASGVYELAEVLRRQRGGTAVVLGALSPRTRNAQVAMYQAGEVDYLVATDAIGMGLNMDVDHVAFSSLRKFDGRHPRDLSAQEIAQIAGRAGRHMRDGTFGTLMDVRPLGPETIEAVEQHRFPPLTRLYYRNNETDFASLAGLIRSLETAPPSPVLVRAREATDLLALRAVARQPDIARMATGYDRVRLLWEVCQIPDFSKTLFDSHARLLSQVYRHLAADDGCLPADWVARHVDRLDRTDGDIDTLVTRIAHVRTWNYVAHRPSWVADSRGFQARTRAIEDRLSDALHDRLTQRFVDRRNAILIRRLDESEPLIGAVTGKGEVVVEGEFVGRLKGFGFAPDEDVRVGEDRALRAAANRALKSEIGRRVAQLAGSPDESFFLADDGMVLWDDDPVARLVPGPDVLSPAVEVLPSDYLDTVSRERVRRRLADWLARRIADLVRPLVKARKATLAGPARGLAFQLTEALGSVPAESVSGLVSALSPDDRKALTRLGVRFGTESAFMPEMLKPARVAARVLLWCVHTGQPPVQPPRAGAVSVAVGGELSASLLQAAGYRPVGGLALRADILERVAAGARQLSRRGRFGPDPSLMALTGCGPAELGDILVALGYRRTVEADGTACFSRRRTRRGTNRTQQEKSRARDSASPFSELGQLRIGGS